MTTTGVCDSANQLASAYQTHTIYYLRSYSDRYKRTSEWCAYTYIYILYIFTDVCLNSKYVHTCIRTDCFQLLLCWSFLPTTLNYLQVSPSSPGVGSSLRNGVQVVRDTFEACQETEEDHTSLQEQTVSDTHHIHPAPLCTTTPPSSQGRTSPYM